jgi:hypothetical protein
LFAARQPRERSLHALSCGRLSPPQLHSHAHSLVPVGFRLFRFWRRRWRNSECLPPSVPIQAWASAGISWTAPSTKHRWRSV